MDKKRLAAVIVTLGKVEVRGKENLERLLACMDELERMMREMNEEDKADA